MPRNPRVVRVADIAGVAEVQRICGGISRATFARWRAGTGVREPFPKRMKKVHSGELWDAAEVRAWLKRNRPPDPEDG